MARKNRHEFWFTKRTENAERTNFRDASEKKRSNTRHDGSF